MKVSRVAKIAPLLPPAASLLLLASCRSREPVPPPAAGDDDAKSDAPRTEPDVSSRVPAAGGGGASSARASTGAGRSTEPPAPGMYAITMIDRSNTCADAGAPAWSNEPLFVPIEPVKDGAWAAELPVNTGVGSPAIDRQEVVLEPGHLARSSIRPDRTCAYEVSRAIEVLEVTPSKIVANVRSSYTDAVRCTLPRKPVACTRDVDVTYTLTKALCAPGCIAHATPLRDGGLETRCAACPDASAR